MTLYQLWLECVLIPTSQLLAYLGLKELALSRRNNFLVTSYDHGYLDLLSTVYKLNMSRSPSNGDQAPVSVFVQCVTMWSVCREADGGNYFCRVVLLSYD